MNYIHVLKMLIYRVWLIPDPRTMFGYFYVTIYCKYKDKLTNFRRCR